LVTQGEDGNTKYFIGSGNEVDSSEVTVNILEEQTSPVSGRASSCTLTREKPIMSGPWSFEWLQDQNLNNVDVGFSPLGKSKPSVQPSKSKCSLKKKTGCSFKHSVHSLKLVLGTGSRFKNF